MVTNTVQGPGGRVLQGYQQPRPRWITELDHVIAVSDNMALIVHAGFQPSPFPKVIWFNCTKCRRDLPIQYLDKGRAGVEKFCSIIDCTDPVPKPYPFRPLAKTASLRPHADQHRGDSASSQHLHVSSVRTALNRLTERFRG